MLFLPYGIWSQLPGINKKTMGMKKLTGFNTFYLDKKKGNIWLEIDKLDQEFLYVNSLPAGLGSNDIGLDRNQLGRSIIVKFKKFGNKLLLIQPNYSFRANSGNEAEKKAVEDSFASSILWGFQVAASQNDRYLVDLTPFLLRDALGITRRLQRQKQGDFQLNKSRSTLHYSKTKNFPLNSEFECWLTFTGKNPGRWVQQVTPDPGNISLRIRHSFIKLPDNNYTPRPYDPRSGFFALRFHDYSTPIDQPLIKRYTCRFRLKKKDPRAQISDPVNPLIFYVDPGTPEPIRSALVEGASWWNQAFQALGYRNAFRVKVLPKGADPMDIRYNVINWVHRSTRGWSYGSSVIDPRTGEIIKGHIALGSLRIRQDYLIAQGLIGNFSAQGNNSAAIKKMALARIRQLSCHEVGHTLGLNHNYAASTINNASVMDYPHPLIKLKANGQINIDQAYPTGMGEWDKVSIAYGYQHFPPESEEKKELQLLLNKAFSKGIIYLTDQDARPAGSSHPLAHLWDNGSHPADELHRVMKIRQVALTNFSEKSIPLGEPLATLEEVLVPIYLFHRYQIEACAKVIGGTYYSHALRGQEQEIIRIVPAQEQRKSLDMLLATLKTENLIIPERILNLIPPRPPGYPKTGDLFSGYTSPNFDPVAAAENVAKLTLTLLLNPQRGSRLNQFHARNKEYPGLEEIINKLLTQTWKKSLNPGLAGEVQRTVNQAVLLALFRLAVHPGATATVRESLFSSITDLKTWLGSRLKTRMAQKNKAHYAYAISLIEKFIKNPQALNLKFDNPIPQGSPIGWRF